MEDTVFFLLTKCLFLCILAGMGQFLKIQDITKISLCVALLCVASYLVIPLPFSPVVIGLQTIVVNIIGLIMKPREAAITVAVYLLMGLIGLPVFSAGSAGIGKLLGPTGGFYFGFLFAVIAISLLRGKKNTVRWYSFLLIVVGIPIQHICGIFFMCLHNEGNIMAAFLTVSLPFLIGDIVKCIMSAFVGVALNKIFK